MELYPSNSLQQTPQMTNTINSGYITDLMQTSGMDGARSIITRPSTRIAVFDKEDDIFYIIATDEAEPKPEDIFASKEEIKELKGEIADVQQSIRALTDAVTNAITANANSNTQSDSGSGGSNKKYVPKPKGENKPNGTYESSVS